MKRVIIVSLLLGCETTSPAHREAEAWMLSTMTRENVACFRRWEAQDASAAHAWLEEGADAKVWEDLAAMGRNLDALECMCGTSKFAFSVCP